MTRREFSKATRLAAWQRCNGLCEACSAKLYVGKFTFDHDKPDTLGGEPSLQNCRVLCSACDRQKTYQCDIPAIAKSNRVRARHLGLKPSSRPMPGGRKSAFKKKMNGVVVRRKGFVS